MKFLKTVGLLVLSFLFLLSCANLNTSKRQLHEPEEIKTPGTPVPDFYVKHQCWKSPFNPHEVLQYWVKLGAQQLNPNAAVAIMGNPKINWQQSTSQRRNPMDVLIPPGEITTAVVFVFTRTQMGTIELMSYGYKDNLGIQRIFVLDIETKCYEKHLLAKQQQSCLDVHLQSAFVVDPI
jgi:hypothetical protein